MKKVLAVLISFVIASLFLVTPNSQALTPQSTLTTCTDLINKSSTALKPTQRSCRNLLAPAIWHIAQSDTPMPTGAGYKTIRVCTSKNPEFSYQYLKTKCAGYQVTTDYWRATTAPVTPIITSSSAIDHQQAQLSLETPASSDSPIAYYLVKNLSTGLTTQVSPDALNLLRISGLQATTSYSFAITAVSIDGISTTSTLSKVITTGAAPVVHVAPVVPTLAAPAFTLSAASETRTVNTVATGFTTSSTGGVIARFAIAPAAPAGMSFSTSTGSFTGTPTAVAGATTYTITATNAAGSATRTFVLTVTALVYAVGERGPGGGIVFYVSAGFTSTGSSCGTTCKYLEVAPSTWYTGAVADDPTLVWSTNTTTATGQDTVTVGTEMGNPDEKFNWKIGQGFYNTSVMKVTGATSTAQAAVLAYAATDASAGQWFIPSMNELNELCKYAKGQTTGVLTARCTNSGTLKTTAFAGADLGGFITPWAFYMSSSENVWPGEALNVLFDDGDVYGVAKDNPTLVRPIRAF